MKREEEVGGVGACSVVCLQRKAEREGGGGGPINLERC